MFVVIAKNASTSLKRLVLSLDHPECEPISDTEKIHDIFGYSYDGKVRIPLSDSSVSRTSRFTRFAVYRDPVERFLSVYYDKVSPLRSSGKPVRRYFSACGIIGADIGTFLDFTVKELEKEDCLNQDEHLRCQSSFYDTSSVDFIVPLERLNSFLIECLGIDITRNSNKSSRPASVTLTEKQKGALKLLYANDYKLLNAENVYLG